MGPPARGRAGQPWVLPLRLPRVGDTLGASSLWNTRRVPILAGHMFSVTNTYSCVVFDVKHLKSFNRKDRVSHTRAALASCAW